jgi:branched-subunit amino acid aminotransferase/4-amino-4-deoxychorismate lyase
LCHNKKILETGTSNILFVKDRKIFSPINKFYKGITYKFFKSKIKKIIKKDILINSLNEFDEIILIGSGKGIASVKTINQINWKRKEFKIYNQLLKHYNSAINNCPKYK